MKDNAFQRRRDIERMLLSGKKLTTSQMMKMYGVGRKAIRRDFDIIGEELPVITKQGYDGGYLLADGVGQHQNTLTQEQLECLEKWLCPVVQRTGKLSCQSYTNLDRTAEVLHRK